MGVRSAGVKPEEGPGGPRLNLWSAGKTVPIDVRMLRYLLGMPSLSVECFVALLLVGSALLAAWLLVRFQGVGPRTLAGALVASAAAWILVSALPSFVDGVTAAGLPDEKLVIAFGLTLPVYTFFFVAAGWFLKNLLGLMQGLR
jgi:hypothetical protein